MVEQEHSTGWKQSAKDYGRSLATSAVGLPIGGTSYAIVEALGSGAAESIGKNTGFGSAVFMGGISAAFKAEKQAEDYALQGQRVKAIAKTIESAFVSTISSTVTGGVAGHEAGAKGLLIGSGVGLFVGIAMSGGIAIDVRDAYKERFNQIDFSNFGVEPDLRFPRKENSIEIPPVYIAESIVAMQEFRDAQKEKVWKNRSGLKRVSDTPDTTLMRRDSALFYLPDVTHYPALDPKERKFMGKFTEEDPAMKIQDEKAGVLIANPPRFIEEFWPYPSSFNGGVGGFDWNNWKYFKENSWKKDVYVLAQYQAVQSLREEIFQTKQLQPEDIVDQYWLVTLIGEGGGKRKREKKNKTAFVPTPVFAPQENVLNSDFEK